MRSAPHEYAADGHRRNGVPRLAPRECACEYKHAGALLGDAFDDIRYARFAYCRARNDNKITLTRSSERGGPVCFAGDEVRPAGEAGDADAEKRFAQYAPSSTQHTRQAETCVLRIAGCVLPVNKEYQ